MGPEPHGAAFSREGKKLNPGDPPAVQDSNCHRKDSPRVGFASAMRERAETCVSWFATSAFLYRTRQGTERGTRTLTILIDHTTK